MTDQNSQFFAILTAVGEAKQANANALGVPWTFAQMGVGDANQTDPVPSPTQTKLINERRRAPLNQVKVDPGNPNIIIAEQVIPPDVGGWWIREIGLYDAAGDLVAVANCAPSFKPLLSQGTGKTQVVRLNIIVTSAANVQLKIDPSVVLATREYVDTSILSVLPKNKVPGTYTKVQINERGIVIEGSNPTTLAGYGITDAYTKTVSDSKVQAAVDGIVNGAPGLLNQLDKIARALDNDPNFAGTMVNALAGKAARANTLAGYNIGDAFTKAETNAAIKATVDALVNGAPGAMDQLSELAAAMGNDPNFATTMLNQLATKAALASPVFTGDPKAPTPAAGDNDASLATTAFVQTAVNGLQAVDVSGSGSITLNATQAGSAIIYLHGALTGDRTVVLPTRWGLYVIRNATNQPFKLTVKMATGTGVEITQGCVSGIMTDATNTLLQQTDFNSPILTGDPRAPTPPTTDNDTSISTTAFVRNVLASLGLGDVSSSATIADMDDVSIPSGLYYVTPYTLHSPEGLQGAVIHKVYGGGGFQLFFPYSVQRVLWRRRGGSQWMEWDELSPKRTTLAGYGIADGVRVQSDQFPAFNSKSAGLNFTEGAIQIREAGKVGAAQSDILFAPAITFHWAERVFKHLLMSSGGDLHWGPTGKLIHTDNMGPVLFALKDAANMAAVRNLLGITNTSSFGAGSGWWRDGQTGLMIQYGTVLAQAETVYPATFQTAFPNFCLMVIPTNLNSATGDDDAFARVVSWTRQNVSLKAEYGTGTGHSPAARNIAYLAIGY